MNDHLLTIPAASARLGVSRATLYRILAEPRPALVTVHIGKRHLVPMSELDRYIGTLAADRSTSIAAG